MRAPAPVPKPPRAALAREETRFATRSAFPVLSKPALAEKVETLAREIAGPGADAETKELARRVAPEGVNKRKRPHAAIARRYLAKRTQNSSIITVVP